MIKVMVMYLTWVLLYIQKFRVGKSFQKVQQKKQKYGQKIQFFTKSVFSILTYFEM